MQTLPTLESNGGMLTYKDDGVDRCLGYLMDFKEHGVHDANFGKVDVTPEAPEKHNQVLDEAMLKGLDERCEIGMGGTFYWSGEKVTTFLGTVVADRAITVRNRSITFTRNGKSYRGRLPKDGNAFNFRRIA